MADDSLRGVACPQCTYENSPGDSQCALCSGMLPLPARTVSTQLAVATGVARSVARTAIDAAGGDINVAALNLLLTYDRSSGGRDPLEAVAEATLLREFAGVPVELVRALLESCKGDAETARIALRAELQEHAIERFDGAPRLGDLSSRKGHEAGRPVPCAICLDEHPAEEAQQLHCGHCFGAACLRMHVEARMAEGDVLLIQCPLAGVAAPSMLRGEGGGTQGDCGSMLTQYELRSLLGPAAFAVLDRRGLEQTVAMDPTLHLCPTPDCPYIVSWCGPQNAGDAPPAIDCPVCKKHRCLLCGVEPFHRGQPCLPRTPCSSPGANAPGGGPESEEALSLAFISSASSNIRICRRCGQGVVKEQGCDKVKCRCGFRFCYRCGSENAQCACTPAEHGFIDNVTGRTDFSGLDGAKSPD